MNSCADSPPLRQGLMLPLTPWLSTLARSIVALTVISARAEVRSHLRHLSVLTHLRSRYPRLSAFCRSRFAACTRLVPRSGRCSCSDQVITIMAVQHYTYGIVRNRYVNVSQGAEQRAQASTCSWRS